MQIQSHGCTHQGYFRQRNEDALLVQPERSLWVVCDGMGGHEAGDYASQWIVGQLKRLPLPARLGSVVHALKRCLIECNRHLQDYACARQLGQIGSTVVVVVISSGRAVVLWAGDSRAYRLRKGRLRQMTDDHSYAREIARATGQVIDPSQPESQAITRAVGASERLELDCMVMEARPGDAWLLCSDGVSGSVSQDRMETILAEASDPATVLVEEALENGSRDNCTAVSLHIQGSHLRAPSSSTEYM